MASALADSLGTGLFMAGAAVLYVTVLGFTAQTVGLVMSFSALVALATTVPLGGLADRFGGRRVLAVIVLARALSLVGLAFVTDVVGFAITLILFAVFGSPVPPINQSLVGLYSGQADRAKRMGQMRALRNAGFALGSLMAVPVLALNNMDAFRIVVFGNAASYLVMAVLLLGLPRKEDAPTPAPVEDRERRSVLRDLPYVRLTAMNSLLALHLSLLSVGLPLWATSYTQLPRELIPLMVTLNTVLAVGAQVPFTRGVEQPGGDGRALRRGGLALAVSCVLLALTVPFPAMPVVLVVMLAATVTQTMGELWQSAGGWESSFRGAPPDKRANYLAFFSLGQGVEQAVAPALIVSVVFPLGVAGWLALAAALGIAGLVAPRITARIREAGADRP